MAKQSLFAILSRSPWWLSIAVAAALFAAVRLFFPDFIALSVALPFVAIGGYAGWRQLRAPSTTKIADILSALRAMSWEDFSTLIEEAFRQDGYTVTKLKGKDVDYEISRNNRVAVVCCKRWKVARTGIAPIRDLFEAGQARNAHDFIYLVARGAHRQCARVCCRKIHPAVERCRVSEVSYPCCARQEKVAFEITI